MPKIFFIKMGSGVGNFLIFCHFEHTCYFSRQVMKRQPDPEVIVVEDSSDDGEENDKEDSGEVEPHPPPINILEHKLGDSMDHSEPQNQESSMEDVTMDSGSDESNVSCLIFLLIRFIL